MALTNRRKHTQKTFAKRDDWPREPGFVAVYDVRPGNGAGLFFQPRSPHGAAAENNHTASARWLHNILCTSPIHLVTDQENSPTETHQVAEQHTVLPTDSTEAFPDTEVECSLRLFYIELETEHNRNAIDNTQS